MLQPPAFDGPLDDGERGLGGKNAGTALPHADILPRDTPASTNIRMGKSSYHTTRVTRCVRES